MSAAAWDDISPVTLTRSWRKLLQIEGHSTASSTDQELDDTSVLSNYETLLRELDSNLVDSDISNWLNADADDQGYQLLSDSEIIQQVTSQEEPPLEDDTPVEDPSVPSSGEVMEMLDKCLLWYEQQSESTTTSVLLLKG